jgi:nitroimidazol reductase NimA-like FMN-containing flavoprotein (pyridoxamine 5'-phosphate oxidase superfamily)
MHGVTHTLRWIPSHRRRRSAHNGAVLIENLDRETCLALLTTVGVGRVGWATADGRAMILPVNFVLDRGSDGDTIVFSTSEGEKLDAVREGRLVTFEVDDVELALRTGWSVLVIGSAEVITSPAQIQRIEQLQLAPWVPLPGRVFVRISAAKITGRRLPLHPGKITVIGRAEP